MTALLLYLIQSSKLNLQDSKITYYFLILLAMLMTTSASSQVTADFTTMDSTTVTNVDDNTRKHETIKERFGEQMQTYFLKEVKKWETKKDIKKNVIYIKFQELS